MLNPVICLHFKALFFDLKQMGILIPGLTPPPPPGMPNGGPRGFQGWYPFYLNNAFKRLELPPHFLLGWEPPFIKSLDPPLFASIKGVHKYSICIFVCWACLVWGFLIQTHLSFSMSKGECFLILEKRTKGLFW